jgi:predicted lipoprotein with Yx(FWY)xxD motif
MNRIRIRTAGAVLAAAVLLLAACSDDDEPTATTDTSESDGDEATTTPDDGGDPYGSTEAPGESSDSTAPAEGASIAVADSSLGSILVDAQGNTLYVFSSDTQGEASTCTGGCAGAWPALTGTVTAGDGVDESLIATVAGEGGTEQATYDGWPLYYYAQDTAPGDTNGQGVGGIWWVIGADGVPIER